MDLNRRNFFGIIGAPLIRHVGPPPAPMAMGGFIPANAGPAMLHSGEAVLPPHMRNQLTIQNLAFALQQLRKMSPPGQISIDTSKPTYIYIRPKEAQ